MRRKSAEVIVMSSRQPLISIILAFADAPAALAWYKQALGATELWNLGGVVGMEIDGAPIFLGSRSKTVGKLL
jgi:PhnB protein